MDRQQALLNHMERIHREMGELIQAGKLKIPYRPKPKKHKCFYCDEPCSVKFCDSCRPRAKREYIERTKKKMKAYQKAYRDRKRKQRQGL